MQKRWRLGIWGVVRIWVTVSVLTGAGLIAHFQAKSDSVPAAKSAVLEYRVFEQSDSVVHTLAIPNNRNYSIKPFVSDTLETVAQMSAKIPNAVAVINAGFFDPVNQKTTSFVTIEGQEVSNPKDNERLMGNPKLTSYLSAILNRSEFRIYRCNGGERRYDIVLHQAPTPSDCQLQHAIAGGPQLLPTDTSQQEGFTDFANGVMTRDAIGGMQPNARTAIGITADSTVVWVMAAQKPTQSDQSGMTLITLANFMKGMGVQKALNLDGGTSSSLYYQGKAPNQDGRTSSSLYYQGQTIDGKHSSTGEALFRSVKSGLAVIENREPL